MKEIQHILVSLAEYGDNAILHVDWAEKEINEIVATLITQARISELKHIDNPTNVWLYHEGLISVKDRIKELQNEQS